MDKHDYFHQRKTKTTFMKNLTLKSKSYLFTYLLICIVLLCLFLIPSCRKETLLPSKGENNLTIAEAKNYFENNFQVTKKPKNTMSTDVSGTPRLTQENPIDGKLPMWDASLLKNLSNENNAVLVPMHKDGLFVHISEKTMVKFGFLNYMMMYKDKDNHIITEWVELKPTEKWVSSKLSRDYEGKILVKDWDGKIKKIYTFGKIKQDISNVGINLKLNKIASIDGSKMDIGNGDIQCTITTTLTIKTESKVCACEGHSYAQWLAGGCPCSIPPTKGYTRTVLVAVEYDCTLPIDETDSPTGNGNNNNGSGSGYSPLGNPNGGTPNPSDYSPISCNPDPNYVVPVIPPPPGTEYILPCSATQIPTEPTPNPSYPTSQTVTPGQFLISLLAIQPTDVSILNFIGSVSNELVLNEMVGYIVANGNTQENRDFLYWAVENLIINPNVPLLALKDIYQSQTSQLYIPRDREPASYLRRTTLSDSYGNDDFSSLSETTPMYISVNGTLTKNSEAFNCHYYAFGLTYSTETLDGYLKWVTKISLPSTVWEKVTGNVKVGDIVMYFKDVNGEAGWTHSAFVTEVDIDGYATKVKSKMAAYEIIEHHPRDIPVSYGATGPSYLTAKGKTSPSRIYYRKK